MNKMDHEKELLRIAKIELLGYLVEDKYSKGQLELEEPSQSILDVDLEGIPVSYLIAALRAGGIVNLAELKDGKLFESRENADRKPNAQKESLSLDDIELSVKDYKFLSYDIALCCWQDVVEESERLIDFWKKNASPPQDLVPECDALGDDVNDVSVIDSEDLLEAFRSQLELSQADAAVLEEIFSRAYEIDERKRTAQSFSLESVFAAISAVSSIHQPQAAISQQKRHCRSLCCGILECLENRKDKSSPDAPDSDLGIQSIALRSKIIGETTRLADVVEVFAAVKTKNGLLHRKTSELEDEAENDEAENDEADEDSRIAVYEDAIYDLNKVFGSVKSAIGEIKYPPTMAFHTYMQLLSTIFDLLEEDKVVEEAGLFLGLLRCFWEPLNINIQCHLAMLALTMANRYQSISSRLGREEGSVHLLDTVQAVFAIIMDYEALDVEDGISCQYFRKSIGDIKEMAKEGVRSLILKDNSHEEDLERELEIVNALSFICIQSSKVLAHALGDHELCNQIVISESNALIKFGCACLFEKLSSKKPPEKQSLIAYRGKVLAGLSKSLYEGVISSVLKAADASIGLDKRRNGSCISIAALELHRMLGGHLRETIESLETASPEVFQFLEQAEKLEIQLLSLVIAGLPTKEGEKEEHNGNGSVQKSKNETFVTDSIQQSLSGGLHCWAVGQSSQPCMSNWLATQARNFKIWVDRVLSVERWDSDSSKQHADSAVDISRIVCDALDTLVKVKVSLPKGILRGLAETIDGTLQSYAEASSKDIGDLDTVIPPIPPLTRFKAGLAEREDEKFKKKAKTKITEPSVQKLCCDPPEHNLCNVEDLALRYRSIIYVLDQIPDMQSKVEQRWKMTANRQTKLQNALTVIGADEITGKEDAWFEDVFGGAVQALERQLDQIASYMGYHLTFIDMHSELLGSLYYLGVNTNPVDPLLVGLDKELGRLCGLLPEEHRNHCVKHLLHAFLEGYKYVLLNGGYSRCFSTSDAEQLGNDLNSIKGVFWADGDGIPNLVIQRDESFVELKLIIEMMKQPLDVVISNYEELAKEDDNQAVANQTKNPFKEDVQTLEYETLLKILCHRADRQASKYLKRHFKLAKK